MIETYIKGSWEKLLRNSLDVALDPKVSATMRSFLYISADEDPAAIHQAILERHKVTENPGAIEVKILPEDFLVTENHGILYLPHDYIVPGGRFNEMYAWDSYWIVRGLLQDGYSEIAKGILENFIYQIRHYGGHILNANRTYYLSRSQPPMHAAMARAVLPFVKRDERVDFLKRATDAISYEYDHFWKTTRYDAERGLFRYGNSEQGSLGLCPEVVIGERDVKRIIPLR
jgi:alpha,alpha-trehalase